jgi:hypothetical protein
MAGLAEVFERRMADAVDLALAGEKARVHLPPKSGGSGFRVSRLEFLHELAYLRMFVAWESFLEQTFYRYMCGSVSVRFGQQTMVGGKYFRSTAAAETAVLGGQPYRLWHNPSQVENRVRLFVVGGRHELIVTSAATMIGHMAALRHRIAHDQKDGAGKCDAATMFFAGRRYRGARPGRFLRDWDIPNRRWLERIRDDLLNLSRQIA